MTSGQWSAPRSLEPYERSGVVGAIKQLPTSSTAA